MKVPFTRGRMLRPSKKKNRPEKVFVAVMLTVNIQNIIRAGLSRYNKGKSIFLKNVHMLRTMQTIKIYLKCLLSLIWAKLQNFIGENECQ